MKGKSKRHRWNESMWRLHIFILKFSDLYNFHYRYFSSKFIELKKCPNCIGMPLFTFRSIEFWVANSKTGKSIVQMPWPKCIAALLLHLLKPSVKIVPDNYKYLDLQKKRSGRSVSNKYNVTPLAQIFCICISYILDSV